MRKSSRVLLGTAAGFSLVGCVLAVGCSSSDNTTNVIVDSGSDSMTPFPTEDSGPEPVLDATAPDQDAAGDDDTTPPDATVDASKDGSAGEMDASKEDAGDAGDAATHDAGDAGDAGHDAGDAGDASTAPVAAPYRLVGRWDTSIAGQARAEWPGSAVVVNFTGKVLSMNVTETTANHTPPNGATAGDWIDVTFTNGAGVAAGTQRIQLTTAQTGAVSLTTTSTTFTAADATLLAAGTAMTPNTAVIVKATDPNAGMISLNTTTPFVPDTAANGGGIINSTAGQFSTKAYYKHIEFIGEEETSGAGVLCTNTANPTTTAEAPATDDEQASYSYLVSKYFNAYHYTTALDFGGVVNDGNSATVDLLPTLWPLTIPVTSNTIDWLPANPPAPAAIQPDAVVVNLALSDFSTIADTTAYAAQQTAITAYENAYGAYIANIHAYYPSAYILVAVGPGFPYGATIYGATAGTNTTVMDGTQVNAWAKAAVTKSGVTMNIATLDLTTANTSGLYGCAYDPGTNTYANMASKVENAFIAALGWTAQ